MVGGERQDFERVQPLLASMGSTIVYVGGLGQGEMLKLINNSLGAANAAALAEALLLAAATGVDLDALEAVVSKGSGASAQLELKAGAMRAHDYTTLFKTEHMLKAVRGGSTDRGRALPGGRACARSPDGGARQGLRG
jgi:3-hydroxyisobutyrate dehydrogenase